MLICNDEPDLMLLTETIPMAQKLPISPALLQVPGYSLYTNFMPSTPNLGGCGVREICVYAAQHLKVTEVTLISSALGQVWIKIALRGSDYLLVGCIYRSPSSNPDDSLRQLKLLLQQASSMSSHLVIVGVFNLPQIVWELELSLALPPTAPSHFSM